MNRFAYLFDRYIGQFIFGFYSAATASLGMISDHSLVSFVRLDYGDWVIYPVLALFLFGLLLAVDAVVRVLPFQWSRWLQSTWLSAFVARWRHWLYFFGVFWFVLLIAVSGVHDDQDQYAFAFMYGGMAFVGMALMIRDGCVDNYNVRKLSGDE